MKKSDAYNFPVVGMDDGFIGVISIGEIRDTLYEDQMDELILAGDITKEAEAVVHAGQELSEAIDIFEMILSI